MPAYALEWWQE